MTDSPSPPVKPFANCPTIVQTVQPGDILHATTNFDLDVFALIDLEDARDDVVMLVKDAGPVGFHAVITRDWARWVAWSVLYEQDRAVTDFKRGKVAAKKRIVGALMAALGRRLTYEVCEQIIDHELEDM